MLTRVYLIYIYIYQRAKAQHAPTGLELWALGTWPQDLWNCSILRDLGAQDPFKVEDLEGSWGPNPVQNAPKIDQKSIKIDSWRILGPKSPKRPKMASKRPFVCHSWGPSWKFIWGHVGPKNRKKTILKAWKNNINFDINFSSILEPLGLHFGRVLGLMLGSKIDQKSIFMFKSSKSQNMHAA